MKCPKCGEEMEDEGIMFCALWVCPACGHKDMDVDFSIEVEE